MTEAQWLESTDPRELLVWVQRTRQVTARKARLFICACVRTAWTTLLDERSRNAVLLGERLAEEEVPEVERVATERAASQAIWHTRAGGARVYNFAAHAACLAVAPREGLDPVGVLGPVFGAGGLAVRQPLLDRVRDLFGTFSFRRVTLDPAWLEFHGGIVRTLAEAADAVRHQTKGNLDSERLAVLGDALEDAGCTNADVLSHCRQAGEHVRGCWVLDLILRGTSCTFEELRDILLGLGFRMQTVADSHIRFEHDSAAAPLVLQPFLDADVVDAATLAEVRRQLDERGLRSRAAFDELFRRSEANA